MRLRQAITKFFGKCPDCHKWSLAMLGQFCFNHECPSRIREQPWIRPATPWPIPPKPEADELTDDQRAYLHERAEERRRQWATHAAVAAERERCAQIADRYRRAYERGSSVTSMAEDLHGAATAKEIAEAIRRAA